jgi:hypothetical protein
MEISFFKRGMKTPVHKVNYSLPVPAKEKIVEINPLKPNDLLKRRAMSPLKIKIPSKNMCEKPTNTPIIHSVY